LNSLFEKDFLDYHAWRDRLAGAIETFRGRLDTSQAMDVEQSLRMYDLVESLRSERMLLAFVAEHSRGKTELINALFFADYRRRLLPSDIGSATLCPTEIFHDPAEAPCLRLLPIETRETDESVAALKRKPIEWIRIALRPDDADALAATLARVAESKKVSVEHARRLGLWNDTSDGRSATPGTGPGEVRVPAWRHALVNFPHPILRAGLAILDTPGLDALGTEPELTLSMIPNADAVLYLLATDSGVTRSDLDLWRRHVRNNAARTVAVLNKVDLAWDDLKGDPQLVPAMAGQLEATARMLDLSRQDVLPLSAQQALVARIRGDAVLLDRSGVPALEALLAGMIPERRRRVAERVAREVGVHVDASCEAVAAQLRSTHAELAELASLRGRNKDMVRTMRVKLEQDRAACRHTVQNFRNTHAVVLKQGLILQSSLDADRIESICQDHRRRLHGQLFTVPLIRMMQQLFDHFEQETVTILGYANRINGLVDTVYASFHEQHGFSRLSPPQLSLARYGEQMQQLRQATIAFCASPATVMQPKGALIRKFHDRRVAEAKSIFRQVSVEAVAWIDRALSPLDIQLKEHEDMLERRVDSLRRITESVREQEARTGELERLEEALRRQLDELEGIRQALRPPGRATAPDAEPQARVA
jgi:hypothetical protein